MHSLYKIYLLILELMLVFHRDRLAVIDILSVYIPSLHPPSPPPVPIVPENWCNRGHFLAGLPVVRGILLYGVPGTGKTMLAEAVAAESEAAVVRVSGAEIYSKFLGETEARLRQLFRTAERQAPSIVLLDEV